MNTQSSGAAASTQDVYVGLDWHKARWKICFITNEHVHKPFSQDPDPAVLLGTLRRRFPAATYHLAYEAGVAGTWIARWFAERAIDCIVVNPADIPLSDKDQRQKTDTRDARKIAESLRSAALVPLYVPSEQAEDDRQFVRTRAALVKKQTRVKNQIKALLAVSGTALPPKGEMTHWTRRFIDWLDGLFADRPRRRQELAVYLEELLWLRQRLLVLTRQIRQMAGTELYSTRVALLVSIPGISTTGAMQLLSELIDIRRFGNFNRLASFVGLVPATHSTGERERTMGITPRSNYLLRALVVESSWVAIRLDPELRTAFETACRRMPKNRAIVVIARKLLSRVHHVLVHNEPYRINNSASQNAARVTLSAHASENSSEAQD